MGKSAVKDEEPVAAQVSAPKKAKGLTKKRGRKDRFAAEANTRKNANGRAITLEGRKRKHHNHVIDWAVRNGLKRATAEMTVAQLRSEVRIIRCGVMK